MGTYSRLGNEMLFLFFVRFPCELNNLFLNIFTLLAVKQSVDNFREFISVRLRVTRPPEICVKLVFKHIHTASGYTIRRQYAVIDWTQQESAIVCRTR